MKILLSLLLLTSLSVFAQDGVAVRSRNGNATNLTAKGTTTAQRVLATNVYAGSLNTTNIEFSDGAATRIGFGAAPFNTTGLYNPPSSTLAVGYMAGHSNTSGHVTAVGYFAGEKNTTGVLTAFGKWAGKENTDGHATFFGNAAGMRNTTSESVAVGDESGAYNTTNNMTTVGYYSGQIMVGSELTAIGFQAGRESTTGIATLVGHNAGYSNSADGLTAVGYESARVNTTGKGTGIGHRSLFSNLTGDATAVGYQSGYNNISGLMTGVGYEAAFANTIGRPAALGYSAARSNTEGSPVAVGYQAGYSSTIGFGTYLGYQAGFAETTGDLIAIGLNAGYGTTTANAPVSDTDGILIGNRANRGVISSTTLTNYIGIGNDVLIDTSNSAKIGTTNTLLTYLYGTTEINGSVAVNNVGADGKIYFQRTGGNQYSFQHDGSKFYFFNNTSNKTVWTVNNNSTMEINGGALSINNVADDPKIYFSRTGGNQFSIQHDTSRFYLYNDTAGAFPWTVLNTGNVGIGLASPTSQLHVVGTNRATQGFTSDGVWATQMPTNAPANNQVITAAGTLGHTRWAAAASGTLPVSVDTQLLNDGDGSLIEIDVNAPDGLGVAGDVGLNFIWNSNAGSSLYRVSDGLHVKGKLSTDDELSAVGALTTGAGVVTIGSGGVNVDGGGLKHARVTTGSVSAGSTSLVTVTWGTAFADANYTVTASVVDSTTSSLSLSVVHVESITASAVTVRVLNNAVGSLSGTVHCIALHD